MTSEGLQRNKPHRKHNRTPTLSSLRINNQSTWAQYSRKETDTKLWGFHYTTAHRR